MTQIQEAGHSSLVVALQTMQNEKDLSNEHTAQNAGTDNSSSLVSLLIQAGSGPLRPLPRFLSNEYIKSNVRNRSKEQVICAVRQTYRYSRSGQFDIASGKEPVMRGPHIIRLQVHVEVPYPHGVKENGSSVKAPSLQQSTTPVGPNSPRSASSTSTATSSLQTPVSTSAHAGSRATAEYKCAAQAARNTARIVLFRNERVETKEKREILKRNR